MYDDAGTYENIIARFLLFKNGEFHDIIKKTNYFRTNRSEIMKFRADSFLLSKNAFLVIFLHFYLIVMKNNDCKEFIINLAGIAKS